MRASVLVPILFSAGRDSWALLKGEPLGLAVDFSSSDGLGSVSVKDSSGANARQNTGADTFFSTTSSAKWVLGPSGVYRQVASGHIAIEYNGDYDLLVEPSAATNLALQSDDFTNASWTKSNMSTAKTATGAADVANSASTLTASAGNATALQAITSGSSLRITSCFIKRRTGTGNIDLTQDNGSTWATQAVTAGWQRFSIAAVTSTNPTVGIRIVTNGDAIDVMWFQHEATAVVSSPIPTTTGTVTRNGDNINVATSKFPLGSEWSMFMDWLLPQAVAAIGAPMMLNDGTLNNYTIWQVGSAGEFIGGSGAGGVTQSSIQVGGVTIVANTRYQSAARFSPNNVNTAINGILGTADTSATQPTVSQLNIGRTGGGSQLLQGGLRVRRIVILPRGIPDGQLPTWQRQ